MIICSCANINDRQVREALTAGARTLADVQVKTGAAMGCGRCRESVNEEIARFCGADQKVPYHAPQLLPSA
ncbi:MAG: (2Fe-2S)-binding protein [Leptospiraceae bacterium]|nr:(2Fe-2S)-binding protein [Leptospiraceae bacterium]